MFGFFLSLTSMIILGGNGGAAQGPTVTHPTYFILGF